MSLKSIERAANLRLLERSVGIKPISVEEQLNTYKRLKEKFSGKLDRGWLGEMYKAIKDDVLLEKFLNEWEPPK